MDIICILDPENEKGIQEKTLILSFYQVKWKEYDIDERKLTK